MCPRRSPSTTAQAASENRGPDDLGYQPRDVAYSHDLDGGTGRAHRAAPITSHWFTLSGDQLREVTEVDRRDPRGLLIAAEYRTHVVRRHWEGVRQISIGRDRDHLYVLTNTDQLLQYRLTGKDGSTSVKLAATVGTGFGTVGTLEYARTVTDDDGARSESSSRPTRNRALAELTIPVDTPTAYSRTELATEGWLDLKSVGARRPASTRGPDARTTASSASTWTARCCFGPTATPRTARARTSCRAASSRPTGSRWPTATEATPSAFSRSEAHHRVRVGRGVDGGTRDEHIGTGLGAPLDRLE